MATALHQPDWLKIYAGRDLQVSGLETFGASRWKEAVLYFLFGVWGNKQNVMYRPKINFGSCATLCLDRLHCVYYAKFVFADEQAWKMEEPPYFRIGDPKVLESTDAQAEVETALIRFVKDAGLRMLVIHFPKGGKLALWKKDRRSEYGVAGWNLNLPATL